MELNITLGFENVPIVHSNFERISFMSKWDQEVLNLRTQGFEVYGAKDLILTQQHDIPSFFLSIAKGIINAQTLDDSYKNALQLEGIECNTNRFWPIFASILNRCIHLSFITGQHGNWVSPQKWRLMVSLNDPNNQVNRIYIFYPPANLFDKEMSKQCIPIPQTFIDFVTISNGLGIGALENQYICGIGPSRGDWEIVTRHIPVYSSLYQELVIETLCWNNSYDSDFEVGNITNSKYKSLIPFAYTFDSWCYNRFFTDVAGEFSVYLWDHEQTKPVREEKSFYEWVLQTLQR